MVKVNFMMKIRGHFMGNKLITGTAQTQVIINSPVIISILIPQTQTRKFMVTIF